MFLFSPGIWIIRQHPFIHVIYKCGLDQTWDPSGPDVEEQEYKECHSILLLIAQVTEESSSHFHSFVGSVGLIGHATSVRNGTCDPQEAPLWYEVLSYLSLVDLWYLFKPVFSSWAQPIYPHLLSFAWLSNNFLEKTLEFSALLVSSGFFWFFVCCLWVLFGGSCLLGLFWFFNLIFCSYHKYNPAVHSHGKLDFTLSRVTP